MSLQTVDTEPTERGWSHYYSDFFRCRHLWALRRLVQTPTGSEAQVRGAMGHVGLAHHYARAQAQQQGRDPNTLYTPEGAVSQWCAQNPEGIPSFNRITEMLRRYSAQVPLGAEQVHAVARAEVACLGVHEGGKGWGLWVVEGNGAPFNRTWRVGTPLPRAKLDGAEVRPTLLNMPGHPDHGAPIVLTHRFDVALEAPSGNVVVLDHKCVSQSPSKSRAKQYSMDGQFAVTRIMASQVFSRFTGAEINFVQTQEPWKVDRIPVPPTPWRDGRFAVDLHRAAHELAQLERDEPDPHQWPMAQHEQVCAPRYGDQGLCPLYDACAFGADPSSR